MSTPNHITHLVRLDNLCRDWSSIHTRSCSYFSSLVNILTQRKETSNLLLNSNNNDNYYKDDKKNVFPSIPSSPFNKNLFSPLQSQSLTLLIYKQSYEIEEILTKIYSILHEFEETVNLMKGVLNQSNKLVNPNNQPILPSSSLTSVDSSTTSTPKTSITKQSLSSKKKKSTKSSNKSNKSSTPQKKKIDLLDNFENPNGIADIPIITSNLYIVRIVEMYEKELYYKKNLIFGGCFKIDYNDDDGDELSGGVKLISERWAAQPYLIFEVEEEMCDRIKIWKRVKEFESIK